MIDTTRSAHPSSGLPKGEGSNIGHLRRLTRPNRDHQREERRQQTIHQTQQDNQENSRQRHEETIPPHIEQMRPRDLAPSLQAKRKVVPVTTIQREQELQYSAQASSQRLERKWGREGQGRDEGEEKSAEEVRSLGSECEERCQHIERECEERHQRMERNFEDDQKSLEQEFQPTGREFEECSRRSEYSHFSFAYSRRRSKRSSRTYLENFPNISNSSTGVR